MNQLLKMFDLSGKRALVTGSSSGIGFALARLDSSSRVEAFRKRASVFSRHDLALRARRGVARCWALAH